MVYYYYITKICFTVLFIQGGTRTYLFYFHGFCKLLLVYIRNFQTILFKKIANIYVTSISIVTVTCTFWQFTTFIQEHLACTYNQILLLLLLKKVSRARLGESDIHPISPKTPAPQYQPIDRKKRKGKRVEDYSRERAAQAIKEALALLLKLGSPTPSKTELARSFQRDTEKGIKVLLYCQVLHRGCA